jgi:hypothetical protein
MKLLSSLLLLAGALLAPAVVSAASFEGKVRFKIESGKEQPMEMAYALKNGLVRIELKSKEGAAPAMIMNPAKQEITMLMAEEKMYMIQPMPKPKDAPAKSPASEVTLEKTGVTETIAGYVGEKYLMKSKDFTGEMWLTEQLGAFMGMGQPEGPFGGKKGAGQGWEAALAGKNMFPLRVVDTAGKGKSAFRMEVISVEKTSLPDSLFSAPSDWQKFDMGGMMRGLMPGGR